MYTIMISVTLTTVMFIKISIIQGVLIREVPLYNYICLNEMPLSFKRLLNLLNIHVPDDFEATMVSSGPASSLKPMALGGAFSMPGGRREGNTECSDMAGQLVSRVTWGGVQSMVYS